MRSLAIGALGALFVVLGAWAGVDSESFTKALADFGPQNDHLVHDFGAGSATVGIGLLISVRRVAWQTRCSSSRPSGTACTLVLGWLVFTTREKA